LIFHIFRFNIGNFIRNLSLATRYFSSLRSARRVYSVPRNNSPLIRDITIDDESATCEGAKPPRASENNSVDGGKLHCSIIGSVHLAFRQINGEWGETYLFANVGKSQSR